MISSLVACAKSNHETQVEKNLPRRTLRSYVRYCRNESLKSNYGNRKRGGGGRGSGTQKTLVFEL